MEAGCAIRLLRDCCLERAPSRVYIATAFLNHTLQQSKHAQPIKRDHTTYYRSTEREPPQICSRVYISICATRMGMQVHFYQYLQRKRAFFLLLLCQIYSMLRERACCAGIPSIAFKHGAFNQRFEIVRLNAQRSAKQLPRSFDVVGFALESAPCPEGRGTSWARYGGGLVQAACLFDVLVCCFCSPL
jgi:hypothetical protein